jgi:hypothetical protein
MPSHAGHKDLRWIPRRQMGHEEVHSNRGPERNQITAQEGCSLELSPHIPHQQVIDSCNSAQEKLIKQEDFDSSD